MPAAIGTCATRSVSAHAFEHPLDVGDRRIRQDAVAEVENKWPGPKRGEDRIDAAVERGAARAQRQRIEVALHRTPALDLISRKIKVNHPIQTNGIDLNILDVALQIAARAPWEPDYLRARHRAPHIGNDSFGRRNAPALKFVGRQNSCPGIEDLHSVDAGLELADKVFA